MEVRSIRQGSGICPDAAGIQRIGEYSVEKICPGVYAIDNDQKESVYLVCGSRKALVIDTGSNQQPVMPVLRCFWAGPVELALTHAHYDHMYHSDEFSSVYLGARDIDAWEAVLQMVVHAGTVGSGKSPKEYPVHTYHPLHDGDVFDLGGKTIRALAVEGHTPGSMAFADEADRCLFLGDAFGWMWMPGCSPLDEYIRSLERMIPALMPYAGFRVLDGHRKQNAFPDFGASLPAYQVAQNMKALCEKILAGEVQPARTDRFFGYETETYSACGASIVLSPEALISLDFSRSPKKQKI